jgi:hypothetical protein
MILFVMMRSALLSRTSAAFLVVLFTEFKHMLCQIFSKTAKKLKEKNNSQYKMKVFLANKNLSLSNTQANHCQRKFD